jgi:hypothetical protein
MSNHQLRARVRAPYELKRSIKKRPKGIPYEQARPEECPASFGPVGDPRS